jgi:hypothetical protein
MSGMFSGMGANLGQSLSHPLNFKSAADPLGMFQSAANPADPVTPPPAPTLGNSSDSLDVAAQQQQMMLQRGRSATLLTGGGGLNSQAQSASKTLLGQ